MRSWAALATLLVFTGCASRPISRADITYKQYVGHADLLELPNHEVKDSVALQLDVKPAKYLYWENEVRMLDEQHPSGTFPTQYSVGITWHLIREDDRR